MIKNDTMERYVADRAPHLAPARHRADVPPAIVPDPWTRPFPWHRPRRVLGTVAR